MKKCLAVILALLICVFVCACAAEETQPEATCGHEAYQELLDALEQENYDAARKLIDAMEGPAETLVPESEATLATEPAVPVTQGESVTADIEMVVLDRQNLLEYFELREDFIFEDPVKCYQYFLLKEEYEKRLVSIEDVVIEISGFDATAYGELDHADQLFFPESYEMNTGDLTFRNVYVTQNGEGHIVLSEFDEKGSCFGGYLMDIAITEVTGKLVLEPK